MPALHALAKLLVTSTDEEVLTYACKAFCYLADGTNDKIQAVIDSGVCGLLVELLFHPSPSVSFLLCEQLVKSSKEMICRHSSLGNSSTLGMVEPQVEFSQIIQKSCEHLCIDWLAEELSLRYLVLITEILGFD